MITHIIEDFSAQGGDKEDCIVWRRESKHVQACCHRDGINAVTS